MSATAHTARMIAKLLAERQTPAKEIPGLIDTVHRTLATLGQKRAAEPLPAPAASAPKRRGRKPREAAPAAIAPMPAPEAAPVPTPTLLRRAEIKEPIEVVPVPPPASLDGMTRGVVRWFDPQTRRGALRLQGVGGDIAVEPELLAKSNITRMFKGQEVEARLAGTPDAPQLLEFRLLAAGTAAHANAGMVRARQQKPVMVELKREALKRGAAREAAEALIPGRRQN